GFTGQGHQRGCRRSQRLRAQESRSGDSDFGGGGIGFGISGAWRASIETLLMVNLASSTDSIARSTSGMFGTNPSRIESLWLKAVTAAKPLSSHVSERHRFAILAPHAAQTVTDLADGGESLDAIQNPGQ